MQAFLAKFIDEFYRLFDTRSRGELHACYHDSCMFSLCVSSNDGAMVVTRQYKYGNLIYDSRNLKKIDENKRLTLLRHGKTAVLDFLRNKFPMTKHDGNSFRVDVLSTAVSNRQFDALIDCFAFLLEQSRDLHGERTLPRRSVEPMSHRSSVETIVDLSSRSRAQWTCSLFPTDIYLCSNSYWVSVWLDGFWAGRRMPWSFRVLIIADHIMLNNATDAQVLVRYFLLMKSEKRAGCPFLASLTCWNFQHTGDGSSSSEANRSHCWCQSAATNGPSICSTIRHEYRVLETVRHRTGTSSLHSALSFRCLIENNWNFDKAAEVFRDLHSQVCSSLLLHSSWWALLEFRIKSLLKPSFNNLTDLNCLSNGQEDTTVCFLLTLFSLAECTHIYFLLLICWTKCIDVNVFNIE